MAEPIKTNDLTVRISEKREKAKAELAKRRLHMPRRPTFDPPKLPRNITDLAEEDVMDLLVQITRYQDHLSGLQAETEIDESAAETILRVAEAKHLAGDWTGASTDRVAVAKAKATLDETVRACDDAYAELKAKRKLYNILVQSLERDAFVVSREISRRIGNRDRAARVDRFTP